MFLKVDNVNIYERSSFMLILSFLNLDSFFKRKRYIFYFQKDYRIRQ